MSEESLKNKISEISKEINPLLEQRELLNRQLRDVQSVDFIKANDIKKSNVQLSDGDGVPYFGIATKFGEWMVKNSTKKWCEWNGSIYLSSEIERGRMSRDAPGRYSDLED